MTIGRSRTSEVHGIVTEDKTDVSIVCESSPMPEVLNGTRSPKPIGDFDPHGKFMELVEEKVPLDSEHCEQEKAQHYMLIEKGDRAKAETGWDNGTTANINPTGEPSGDCRTELSFDPDWGIEGNFETAWVH